MRARRIIAPNGKVLPGSASGPRNTNAPIAIRASTYRTMWVRSAWRSSRLRRLISTRNGENQVLQRMADLQEQQTRIAAGKDQIPEVEKRDRHQRRERWHPLVR